MVTNKQVQDEFRKFLDGEKIEYQLLKLYFHQHGGFSRMTVDDSDEVKNAIGMTVGHGGITISFMDLVEEDDVYYAREEDSVFVEIDRDTGYRLREMVDKASETLCDINESGSKGFDDHSNIFG